MVEAHDHTEYSVKTHRHSADFIQTADAVVTNTVAETTIMGAGVGSLTVPRGWWTPGKMVRITGHGVYSTPVVGSEVTVRVYIGDTVVGSVLTSALVSNATDEAWSGEIEILCRDGGAGGVVVCGGSVHYESSSAGAANRVFDSLDNDGAETAIDFTTGELDIDVTVQWDSATSSRSVTSTIMTMELL